MKAHSLEEPGGKRGSISAAGELACAGGPVGVKPLHHGGACRPSRGQCLARRLGRGRRGRQAGGSRDRQGGARPWGSWRAKRSLNHGPGVFCDTRYNSGPRVMFLLSKQFNGQTQLGQG